MTKTFSRWDSKAGVSALQEKRRELRLGTDRGFEVHGKGDNPTPEFQKCKNEKVIPSHTGALITLGKNRGNSGTGGSCMSGYGGRGDTHAAEIDLRAGLGGWQAQSHGSGRLIADKSDLDAAWLTVTQKTDEEHRFPDGRNGKSKTRSAVVMSADGVRMRAREGVKIWAGSDEINSQGSKVTRKAYGIDLIAGDGEDMQPIPKGKNLQAALQGLSNEIDGLRGIVDGFVTSQMAFNGAVAMHTHTTMFFAIPVTPSPSLQIAGPANLVECALKVKVPCLMQKVGLVLYNLKFLNAIGDGYINSLNNHTN